MSPVTRASVAGRAYLDLRAKARTEGRATEELLVLYALEGFLARLSASGHSDDFVLKGGVLLAAFGTRRATRDVDLAGRQMDNDSQRVLRVIRDITSTDLPRDSGDGLVFDGNHATAEVIRDDDAYSGVRVSLAVRLATSRMRFHVDVNIGDPIWPAPERVEVPRLLGGDAIELAGYPLQMVYAEKIVTAVQRGVVNTRWRDFGDVWTLSGQHDIAGQLLQDAIAQVAQHRRADVAPLPELLDGYPAIAQAKWAAWRHKQSHSYLPAEFAQVLADFIAFAEPALEGTLAGLTWDPARRSWL